MSSTSLGRGSTEQIVEELKAWVERRNDHREAQSYMHRTLFSVLHTTACYATTSPSPSRDIFLLLQESMDSRALVWVMCDMSSASLCGGRIVEYAEEVKTWIGRRKDYRKAEMYMYWTLFSATTTRRLLKSEEREGQLLNF